MTFKTSIASYPQRGPYGDRTYRGNASGLLVKDLLTLVHPDPAALFVDPAEGGGTSRDVAAELGVRYEGRDLRTGFDLLKTDLGAHLGQPAQTIFFHPPYHGMVRYSGELWGEAHPSDLSRCASLDDFLGKLQLALWNIYDALAGKGHYAVLMGNWRSGGEYLPLASLLYQIAPGRLREEIIKVQHNVGSQHDARTFGYQYFGHPFIAIKHEKLLIFQKDKAVFALNVALALTGAAGARVDGTWRNLVQRVLMRAGEPLTLEAIYTAVEASPKARRNQNWQAKVRQILYSDPDNFLRVERATYALAA